MLKQAMGNRRVRFANDAYSVPSITGKDVLMDLNVLIEHATARFGFENHRDTLLIELYTQTLAQQQMQHMKKKRYIKEKKTRDGTAENRTWKNAQNASFLLQSSNLTEWPAKDIRHMIERKRKINSEFSPIYSAECKTNNN